MRLCTRRAFWSAHFLVRMLVFLLQQKQTARSNVIIMVAFVRSLTVHSTSGLLLFFNCAKKSRPAGQRDEQMSAKWRGWGGRTLNAGGSGGIDITFYLDAFLSPMHVYALSSTAATHNRSAMEIHAFPLFSRRTLSITHFRCMAI